MTWVTDSVWTCDGCGEDWHAKIRQWTERRKRSRHHRPHPECLTIGTKYVHYCSEECAEPGDAAEVRAALGPKKRIEFLPHHTALVGKFKRGPVGVPHHVVMDESHRIRMEDLKKALGEVKEMLDDG